MKLQLITLSGLLLAVLPTLCQNLVPNPHFDYFTDCPTDHNQLRYAYPWYSPNGESSDFAHKCADSSYAGVPFNNWGFQFPVAGNGYAGIRTWAEPFGPVQSQYREYLAVKLLDTLRAGENYYLSFHVSPGDSLQYASDAIGMVLEDSALLLGYILPYTPVLENAPGNLITQDYSWHKISGEYRAKGGEIHLIIGNFKDDDHTTVISRPGKSHLFGSTYYYVDAVVVEPCSARTPPFLIRENDTTICAETALTLHTIFAENAQFAWTDGYTTPSRPVSEAGTYTVEAFINGCTVRDSVQVSITDPPLIDLGPDRLLCPGEEILLETGLSSGLMRWEDGSGGYSRTITAPGAYTAASLLGGCERSSSVVVFDGEKGMPPPFQDALLCAGETLLLDPTLPGSRYLWENGDTLALRSIAVAGSYTLSIDNACFTATTTYEVRAGDCGCALFVANVFTPNGDGLLDLFRPEARPEITNLTWRLHDRWGRQMYAGSDADTGWNGEFRGKPAPAGVYFWTARFLCRELGAQRVAQQRGQVLLVR